MTWTDQISYECIKSGIGVQGEADQSQPEAADGNSAVMAELEVEKSWIGQEVATLLQENSECAPSLSTGVLMLM